MRILCITIILGLVPTGTEGAADGKGVRKMETLTISSTAFQDRGMIPNRYTCDGSDINPPISFGHVPVGTKSLALIVDDPDAPGGTWVHWVMWNIPPDVSGIAEKSVPEGAVQGANSWHGIRYGGPCPPSGTHRYIFKVYALDTMLNLKVRGGKQELERAMEGHILGKGEMVGTYRH